MLELKNIHFDVNGKTLVNNLSFKAKPGEHLVILGANGAGKSTLLKILSGEHKNFTGDILYNGTHVNEFSNAELARLRAVMPQEVQLSFPFRAQEVVEMGHSPHFNLQDSNTITNECMALFDVNHLAKRRYPTLSGGEKQRVQLARVICQLDQHREDDLNNKPRFLFLDECTSALDPAHQHAVFSAVGKIKENNVGVISVMHDLNLASQYADRILILKAGEILSIGDVFETLTAKNMKEAYDIDAQVIEHPSTKKPLVISNGSVLTI